MAVAMYLHEFYMNEYEETINEVSKLGCLCKCPVLGAQIILCAWGFSTI